MLLISTGPGGFCCRLATSYWNKSEWIVPELSLEFCAIRLDDVHMSLLSTEVNSAPVIHRRITNTSFVIV